MDCRARRIVAALDLSHVTLSYVWGSIAHVEGYNDQLPDVLPSIIEDSISVTLSLGYEYLWIDRYCIDQSKAGEVKHQVEMMDLIYRN